MRIIGAGLAGCLAGALDSSAKIIEFGPKKDTHQAVLRFRSDKIAKATGIPFKKVKVYKGIWHNDRSVPLTPRAIALYSRKVSDTVSYRSITNIDTVDRYISPVDFHDILRSQCEGRITYNAEPIIPHPTGYRATPLISTLPIFALCKMLDIPLDIDHNHSKIYVTKYRLEDCEAYMTYYYTDPVIKCYRASITGNELIIESKWPIDDDDVKGVIRSFGLHGAPMERILDNHEQPNGKMTPMKENLRRAIILDLTLERNIYSLGRFATWRNLLLDDIFDDILVIKRLINKDHYSHMLRK